MSETLVTKRVRHLGPGRVMMIAVVLVLGSGVFIWWRQAHPDFNRYLPALAAIKSHHLQQDDWGGIDLSGPFPGITPRDQAMITWLDNGDFRALFPTYYGEGKAIAGWMYTSRPLTDDDTQPRVSGIHFDQRVIAVGSYNGLVLDGKLNANWYRVSYKIH